jgi:general secretion pathway protein I
LSRAGFSLIEALVALAIASVALLSIFSLEQQMTREQRRLDAVLDESRLQRSAIAAVELVNPMARPTGEIDVGSDLKVTWTSTPISDERQNVAFPNGPGSYKVQLFRVNVHLADDAGRAIGDYRIDRVGWRNLQPLSGAFY